MANHKHDWQESYVSWIQHEERYDDGTVKTSQQKDVKIFYCPTCELYRRTDNWEWKKPTGDENGELIND